MDQLSYLPRLEREKLRVWDNQRDACCGYLNKRAGRGSTLSKGKWQKRWFVLRLQISGHENYSLSYYHSPEEKSPRQSFSLDSATIAKSGGSNLLNAFQLICADGMNVMMGCDSESQMEAWMDTLNYAIGIATERGKIQRDRWGANPSESQTLRSIRTIQETVSNISTLHGSPIAPRSSESPEKRLTLIGVGDSKPSDESGDKLEDITNPFQTASSGSPCLRLDVDINTMPPGSTQRNQFEEMFRGDICRSLGIDSNMVDVLCVRPAPGMDWLTVVDFDVYVTEEALGLTDYELEEIAQDEKKMDDVAAECSERRLELLDTLLGLVKDPTSALYNGFVTCNVDPSFTSGITGEVSGDSDSFEVYSSDPEILSIMKKYKDVHVPNDIPNVSHIRINLSFEGRMKPLYVPNPLVLRKRCCAVFPFEVKRAIGMMGNMQELWIEPVALVPKGLPKNMLDPIYFNPSARLNGCLAINAVHLKADLCYDVLCEDNRTEVMKLLSEEERLNIKNTFEAYDVNGDGCVSRVELEELVRNRTAQRKELIDAKFTELLQENNSDDSFFQAEEYRRMHYQQLAEAQKKLLKMFEAADVDGDGTISFAEFLLAEAWWLRCTLNPENASLF